MSENGKLSFRKRISIVKSTVIKTLLASKELSKLGSGSSKNGYYSLSTIMEVFQPALVENDLDFEITMQDNQVTGIWYDCQGDSEKQCEVVFYLERLAKIIENLERLPQMQNAIQTEGSIKTYFRRYALTAFLNLPATDEIDSNLNGSQKEEAKNLPNKEPSYLPDLTNISKLSESAGFNGDDLIKLIKALFNKSELLKLKADEEILLIDYLSIKSVCKIANVSHDEFNKYLNSMFKKKNWFGLTSEEKIRTKEDLEKMINNPLTSGGESIG